MNIGMYPYIRFNLHENQCQLQILLFFAKVLDHIQLLISMKIVAINRLNLVPHMLVGDCYYFYTI